MTDTEPRVVGEPRKKPFLWRAGYTFGECMQLLAVGLALEFLLFTGAGIWGPLKLLIIAFLLVSIMKGYAWILLVAFQLSVFLTAPRDLAFSSIPLIFGYVLAALALLIYTLRVDTLKNRCSEAFAMLFSKPEDGNGQNPVGRVTIESACGFALQTLFVVLVSAMSILLLTTLPITNSNRADLLRASVLNGNVLWPGATLCILAVAAYVVIREFAWRGMTSSQGRLYLRSVFMREHHTEFRSVVKQQQKLRRRAAVKAKKEKKRLRPT